MEDLVDDSGIAESGTRSVLVYPNPFNAFTTIYFNEAIDQSIHVRIYDLLGNEVYSNTNIVGNSIVLFAQDLGKGVYVLVIESDDSEQVVQTIRIVIQ